MLFFSLGPFEFGEEQALTLPNETSVFPSPSFPNWGYHWPQASLFSDEKGTGFTFSKRLIVENFSVKVNRFKKKKKKVL